MNLEPDGPTARLESAKKERKGSKEVNLAGLSVNYRTWQLEVMGEGVWGKMILKIRILDTAPRSNFFAPS